MNRPLLPAAGKSRAIVMGTWRYDEPALGPYLPAVENSFRRFAQMLTSPLCGWPASSITRVANEPDAGRVPDLLMTRFGEAEDVALFYYVGHGLLSDDEDTELCLGLTGTVSREPHRRVPTSLLFPAVRRALLKSTATTKIVILDCCHSGTVFRPVLAGTTVSSPDAVPAEFLDGADVEGSYVLVAAARDKNAYYELGSQSSSPQTYFTKYLVDLVEHGIEGAPPELSMEALFSRLRSSLVAGGHPHPDRRNYQFGAEYRFCANVAATPPQSAGQEARPPREYPGKRPAAVRRRRPIILGAFLAPAIGVAVGASLIIPSLSRHSAPPAPLSYTFTTAVHDHGLVIDRVWSVGGSGDSVFTESLTVSNHTRSAVRTSYVEPVPPALRASIAGARFTPSRPKITGADAMLDWEMAVPAGGHLSYGYSADLPSGAPTRAELAQWAASLSGPGRPSSAAPTGRLRSLRIHLASSRVTAGRSIRITLSGLLTDGRKAPPADLAAATWQSSDHAILTVSRNGTMTAIKPGTARVIARVGALVTSVTVTVVRATAAAPSPAPSPSVGYPYPTPPATQRTSTPTNTPPPSSTHPASSSPTAVLTTTPPPI